ncbi:MAG: HAD family hydrolase, partial [Alphaproteobacteria bacterium]|nr:HAD family hydrolase [Alphaproteobacteria bacterium]
MSAAQKTIVFDWNGTLLDDVGSAHETLNVIMRHFGREEVSFSTFCECFDMPLTKFYGNLGFTDHEIAVHMPAMTDLFHDHYETKVLAAPLRKGARALLAKLKAHGVARVILSNHIMPSIDHHLRRLKASSAIDFVLTNENRAEQMLHIPKGERLRRYMGKLGLKPENTVIVGDSRCDAQEARNQAVGGNGSGDKGAGSDQRPCSNLDAGHHHGAGTDAGTLAHHD